ncbi:hypothetical protein A1355_21790 [Methylomonas koyamae]|uniref:Uncharacterized protein n=1 Tax=Methylomonas koyamae TaxID=702114 RepID=A0A177NYV0_9GAMM|nr:hypothetical protein A1355_21790 [Methylomonas koyamae]
MKPTPDSGENLSTAYGWGSAEQKILDAAYHRLDAEQKRLGVEYRRCSGRICRRHWPPRGALRRTPVQTERFSGVQDRIGGARIGDSL